MAVSRNPTRRIAGIDVGGTFTDLIVVDDASGEVRIAKVPTTVDNQAFGVLAALAAAGVDPASLDAIVHGTTTTTNAMLERKIATVGLITTKGFRDVLELGRRTRPTPYGLKGRFVPLIERHRRLEVDERMDADGRVLVALDEGAVAAVMSGPASGVIAAAATAMQAGSRAGEFANVVTYDMGGTSSDVALVLGGMPSVSSDLELEYAMPIHVPMVDVHTIGAGGGSIASVDASGMLRVGPESAGATPGPICYGRGGTRPTN